MRIVIAMARLFLVLNGRAEAHHTADHGNARRIPPRGVDLGAPDGSFPIAINNRQQAVGAWRTPTVEEGLIVENFRSFLWQDGFLVELGTLGGTDTLAAG
jgi:hypothetical protein